MTESPAGKTPRDCERWWPFVWHSWGQWEVFEQRRAVRARDKTPVGVTITQKRRCTCCGYEQWDKQTVLI